MMIRTVCEIGPELVWVQLDGDCRVCLLPSEFRHQRIPLFLGVRCIVAVGDIHPSLTPFVVQNP